MGQNYGSTQTQHSIGENIPYTTAGELIKGTQGQLVMFSETDPTTTLNVKTGYYDTATGQWVENTPGATPAFVLAEGTGTVSGSGATVNLINNNKSVKFGLSVTDTNTDYKFIGWYTSLGAKPNETTVDGDVTGFGLRTVTGLSVPLTTTTYYALYVPYASGDLTVTHSQKSDSAGKCDDTDGTFDKNNYKSTEVPATVKQRVKDVLSKAKDSSTGVDDYYGANTGYYYTRININEDTVSDYNRSKFARSFTTANVKDKVFRVYAYMILPGEGDTVDDSRIVISDPYYMTMFDYATKNLVIERE